MTFMSFLIRKKRVEEAGALTSRIYALTRGTKHVVRGSPVATRYASASPRRVAPLISDKRGHVGHHVTARNVQVCGHDGTCTATSCSCVVTDHWCGRGCGCNNKCGNRYVGCDCKRGACGTEECPCYAAHQECIVGVCTSCGATDLAVRGAETDDICCNISLQQELPKKIGVSFSTTHGWGAFARQHIKGGEFVCEYLGDLISQVEAERRGPWYSVAGVNYLFDLNDKLVVDAYRLGNKSRYINHSTQLANCQTKIVAVEGEHRIGIWAARDIQIGEELYFDYDVNYLFDLNDKLVVDAFRLGNKSRYINHSTQLANCQTKIVAVEGEHRIGIWAARDMESRI
ncbi:TPA: LOW QUALITY PROTEIN: hypothetical protein N0F65_012349 [Lagenidium giganteum]|uniref:SET domain-containing protein n=1 Tax=Lagenidium giganteum TaxID=4803 RepID=A0AAV2YGM2_9STRA|nr:TPA: LOW QUALITY PROTEIN: hypothetical protein N0F65_012349 [Lagenidium giganteum]